MSEYLGQLYDICCAIRFCAVCVFIILMKTEGLTVFGVRVKTNDSPLLDAFTMPLKLYECRLMIGRVDILSHSQ